MNWLQILGSPFLVVLGGIITWFLKSRSEELRAIEEKLREDRRKIYSEILVPYIHLFSGLKAEGHLQSLKIVKSYEYRKSAFELCLFGSDKVILAYNAFMKYALKVETNATQNSTTMLHLMGELLLEIRKSLGNKNTKLSDFDMLSSMIKDLDQHKQKT